MKLLIIGIDGLDPFFIEDFLDYLPTFQKLRQECEWHLVHCDSTIPNSLSGWSSIYTGLLAKDHGFSDWKMFEDISAWSGLAEILKSKGLFWDYLNAAGLSVGLLNPTLVWPAEIGKGWCVAGFPSPFKGGEFNATRGFYSSPEVAELAPQDYIVDVADLCEITDEDRSTWYIPKVKELTYSRTEFALRLFRGLPVDVGFVCYTILDRIGHAAVHFFPYKPGFSEDINPLENAHKEILEGYKIIDTAVSTLLQEIQPERLLICADHGLNFSTKTPVPMSIQGGEATGDPFALGHTWVTIGLSKGPNTKPGQTEDTDLTWAFYKIFELLELPSPRVGNRIEEEQGFTKEELNAIKQKLEGLGYL